MVLHIGNNRAVPFRDVVAVLDARTALCKGALDMGECSGEDVRSVIVAVCEGREKRLASPISTHALSQRAFI